MVFPDIVVQGPPSRIDRHFRLGNCLAAELNKSIQGIVLPHVTEVVLLSPPREQRHRQLTPPEIDYLLKLAQEVKTNPGRYKNALGGSTLAMILEKPSLSTRVAF